MAANPQNLLSQHSGTTVAWERSIPRPKLALVQAPQWKTSLQSLAAAVKTTAEAKPASSENQLSSMSEVLKFLRKYNIVSVANVFNKIHAEGAAWISSSCLRKHALW